MKSLLIIIVIIIILYILDCKIIKDNINKILNINNKSHEISYNKNFQVFIDTHNQLNNNVKLQNVNDNMLELNDQTVTMIKNDIRKFFSKHNYTIEYITNTNNTNNSLYTLIGKNGIYIPFFPINVYVYNNNNKKKKIKLGKKLLILSIVIDSDTDNFNIIKITNDIDNKYINNSRRSRNMNDTNTDIMNANTDIMNDTNVGVMNTNVGSMNTNVGSMNTNVGSMNTNVGSMNTNVGSMNTNSDIMNTNSDIMNTNIINSDIIPEVDDNIINNILDNYIDSETPAFENNKTNDLFLKKDMNENKIDRFDLDDSLIPDSINISESEK